MRKQEFARLTVDVIEEYRRRWGWVPREAVYLIAEEAAKELKYKPRVPDELTIRRDIKTLGCGPDVPMTPVAINIRRLLVKSMERSNG
jgi:hypothetical protein